MTTTEFAFKLLDELDKRIKTKTAGILAGNLSHDEYKAATGHYQALGQFAVFIRELAKKAEDDE